MMNCCCCESQQEAWIREAAEGKPNRFRKDNPRVIDMLDGPQAVEEGLIDEVGGIARALEKLNELMKKAAGTEN